MKRRITKVLNRAGVTMSWTLPPLHGAPRSISFPAFVVTHVDAEALDFLRSDGPTVGIEHAFQRGSLEVVEDSETGLSDAADFEVSK